jgi:hypothetical protein
LLQHSEISFQWEECVNWNTALSSNLLDFSPPNNYPPNLIPCLSGKLHPQKLTYTLMMDAVEVAHNGVVLEGWKTSTMMDYLRT